MGMLKSSPRRVETPVIQTTQGISRSARGSVVLKMCPQETAALTMVQRMTITPMRPARTAMRDDTYRRASSRSPLTWQSIRRLTSPRVRPALLMAKRVARETIAAKRPKRSTPRYLPKRVAAISGVNTESGLTSSETTMELTSRRLRSAAWAAGVA